ncbi:trypsin alpha-3-like [Neocloeon triangulifer]|uniref:trypsin alpha-3-like n=1 Tax=Neocloeon triangulifer TaxID=2078957 RepID=UPI00286F12A4|nr:trypsin alpha-3-like [Neocloeon triangulifer]XP_059468625.1 trypsin alpha-3-like [Neocloeon triangulifer]
MVSAVSIIFPILLLFSLGEAVTRGGRATYVEYQVSIRDSSYGPPICGGAIISSRWVITTAQCAEKIYTRDGWIVDGTLEASKPGSIREKAEVVFHPDYNNPVGYADIALIRVSKDFFLDDNTKPVTLSSIPILIGETGKVSGWGATYFGGPNSDVLMYLHLPVIDHTNCSVNLAEVNYQVHNDQYCAGEIGNDAATCTVDAGGPMVSNNYGTLIGLVSRNSCTYDGRPTVFTNVGYYRDWINSVTGV